MDETVRPTQPSSLLLVADLAVDRADDPRQPRAAVAHRFQRFESPFGHAGQKLHQWMVATRYFHGLRGDSGGTGGVDDAFAQQFPHGIDAEITGANKFGPPGLVDETDAHAYRAGLARLSA